MTHEEIFIQKLGVYLNLDFKDFDKQRITLYLKEYWQSFPIDVKKEVLIGIPEKWYYTNLRRVNDAPPCTREILLKEAERICEDTGIDIKVFMKSEKRKSKCIITDTRKVFSIYMMRNYMTDRKLLEQFFKVDHSTISFYLIGRRTPYIPKREKKTA